MFLPHFKAALLSPLRVCSCDHGARVLGHASYSTAAACTIITVLYSRRPTPCTTRAVVGASNGIYLHSCGRTIHSGGASSKVSSYRFAKRGLLPPWDIFIVNSIIYSCRVAVGSVTCTRNHPRQSSSVSSDLPYRFINRLSCTHYINMVGGRYHCIMVRSFLHIRYYCCFVEGY